MVLVPTKNKSELFRNGYHIYGRQQARKLFNPDIGTCAHHTRDLRTSMSDPGSAHIQYRVLVNNCEKLIFLSRHFYSTFQNYEIENEAIIFAFHTDKKTKNSEVI